MCGIYGFTGNEDRDILERMSRTVVHRGPDEKGVYADGKMNFGIRRLSIIDIETGQQPIHNEEKSVWTVFNGEIYNAGEIRIDLERKGHRFYTHHADTEVIVHLYEEYGESFADRMNGMFAFALWDKDREKLLLVRDRMGVKPLFFTLRDGILIFSSEIKAILAHPRYNCKLNFEAVYHYFTFKNVPAPLTAFEGIYSLGPGEMISYARGEITRERWWKIIFKENEYREESEIQTTLSELLEDATRIRMFSDVPYGAYLSGGVDSSAVVAYMTRFSNKPLRTFSLGYKDELSNKEADLYYARKVSRFFKTEHYEYIMSHNELIDEIKSVIEAFDQPFSGTISTFFLSKLIKQHVKVALSGDGADELFGSYLSHRIAQPIYHYKKLRAEKNKCEITHEEKRHLSPCSFDFLDELFERSGGDEIKWRYHLYLFSDEEKKDLLTENFRNNLNNVDTYSMVSSYFSALSAKGPLNRVLEMEWNTQLPDQVLAFIDFLSMAHSVEIRSPFLDHRLVEFVATIPGGLKIKNGNVKDILKKTVAPVLPEGIINRPKEGFVMPIFHWMTEKLRDYCKTTLSKSRLRRHGFFNEAAIEGILNDYFKGRLENAGRVWNLMMFQVWWERYFG